MISRQQKEREVRILTNVKCLILIFAPLLIIHGERRQEQRDTENKESMTT